MILQVEGLTKRFTRGKTGFYAVDDIDLIANQSDFISIIGRSGSGKSTLLNMIAGLLTPTSGSIIIHGKETSLLSDKEKSYLRNTAIGYIAQGQSTLSNLSVIDNVRLPYYLSKRLGDPTDQALKLLEEVGISHLASEYPSHLSGGELRRVSIARALINSPSIIIADEPTSDLDKETTCEIMRLFQRIAQNGTIVLMVTHELDTTAYGNQVYKMDAGKLAFSA